MAQKPPDRRHPYGHLRAETIASLVAAFIMLVVGLQVLSSAVDDLFHPIEHEPSPLTAIVALLCAAIMYVVYRYNLSLAKRIKSSAVLAAAYDNRSDALVSLGTAAGIIAAILGLPILDVITALIVGLIILKTAIEIFVEAVHTLIDGFDHEKSAELIMLITNVAHVLEVIDIKGRTHGNMSFVDVTIALPASLNISEAHRICNAIKGTVQTIDPYCTVHIQVVPK